ncbi:hypothetical protein [Lacimicrobium alkaliphilum]|uniref:Uncharacterized protein n=1 Tax=Lacimicrobium alkaliphilum TaxID=1526571 RepID=A0ABQ1R500_9ALTE|nr:hypothetical protein [Lacimicrobium alkaliphilum]GGD54193.1 hypothetical protein GCM10011357_07340 [Lacimicrobium alkaliphilum]
MQKSLIIASTVWLLPFVCSAQSYTQYDKNSEKLVMSNALLATDNINPVIDHKTSALGWQLDANGELVNLNRALQLKLDYNARFNQWQQQPDAVLEDSSFLQAGIEGHGRLFLSGNWQLNGSAGYQYNNHMPGSGLSRLRKNIIATDTRHYSHAQLGASYGHEASNRRITLNYHRGSVRYSDDNDYSSEFELDQSTISAEIAFRLSAATNLIFEVEHQQDDYLSVRRSDSDKTRLLAGFEWDYSGLTRIRALAGGYKRTIDQQADNNGSAWQVALHYSPRKDTGIRIESSQDSIAGDSELATDSRMRRMLLELTYQYSELWQWGMLVSAAETRFDEPQSVRYLDEVLARVWVKLALKQHHHFRLSLQHSENELSTGALDFQQAQITASWQYRF